MDNLILAPVELKMMTKEEAVSKASELLKRIGLYDKKTPIPANCQAVKNSESPSSEAYA